jgi:23S rRNA (uracil1939-C5)-methyltransferase
MTAEPFCRYYGTCGGCQLQHVDGEEYRRVKLATLMDALKSAGIEWSTPELVDAHGEGRRRVTLHVRVGGGKITAGFMARRSHDLVDIDACPILVPALTQAADIARSLGEKLGDCDVSLTAADNGLDAAVKAERKLASKQQPFAAALADELKLTRLTVNGETLATFVKPVVAMAGIGVEVPPGSFLQATHAGEETLAKLVVAGVGKAKSVADLFCGLGPFALTLAKQARVSAIDDDKQAIAALQTAARHAQGLKPIAATVRNLMREPLTEMELKDFDAVIFDPPRAGAEAQARRLAKSAVKKIVAASCNPQTFARDARLLLDGGYQMTRLTAIDQFKWSTHLECVGVFGR